MPSPLHAWLLGQHGCGIPLERLQSEDSKGRQWRMQAIGRKGYPSEKLTNIYKCQDPRLKDHTIVHR